MNQFIYGVYPEAERWRVNLVFLLSAVLLVPLMIPRLPAKGVNAAVFFLALPVVAFFLLYGGGLAGLGVSWTASALSTFAESINGAGNALLRLAANAPGLGLVFWLLGKLILLVGMLAAAVVWPLLWLRDQIQASYQAVWIDFAMTAVIAAGLVFVLGGGVRALRAVIGTVVTFAGIGVVIAVMGLDHGGLPVVDTRLWGGLLVTLVVAVTGIVASMPVGIALALGRRSSIPLIRIFSIAFIEFWRGVPLITVLFNATYMLPLFVPAGFTIDGLVRALIGIALFTGAYQAENIRGGLA